MPKDGPCDDVPCLRVRRFGRTGAEAPELAPYLMSAPAPERPRVLGLGEGRRQALRSVAAMCAASATQHRLARGSLAMSLGAAGRLTG
jgi:hypothetical protein